MRFGFRCAAVVLGALSSAPVHAQLVPKSPPADPKIPGKRPAVTWAVKADPGPKFEAPNDKTGEIALAFGGAGVIFPATPSRYALVGIPPLKFGSEPLIQVADLRTSKLIGRALPVTGESLLFTNFIVAADGSTVAYRVEDPKQPAIKIWETESGKKRTLVVEDDKDILVHPVAFVGENRLLGTKLNLVARTYTGQVWDTTTSKAVVAFEMKSGVLGDPGNTVRTVSPGGGFFATIENDLQSQWVVVWNLKTGTKAGEISLPQMPRGATQQHLVLSFSPNGDELAIVTQTDAMPKRWGLIRAWDMKTGEKACEHSIGYDIPNLKSLTEAHNSCLTWSPDGKAWILFGHLVLDRATGAVIGKFGAEPKDAGEVSPRRFVGPDHVTGFGGDVFDRTLVLEPFKPKK